MLHYQLNQFQHSFEKAISQGAEKFYAIHGVGTGRLKQEIHRLLRTYKEVKSFNNDYNPRYGFGATEIILK
jgi:dsDNA-specific endonuclease/ATPase MutS2